MRKTKNISFNGSDITVKELTMAELAETLDYVSATADSLDMIFDARLPSQAVVISSNIDRENLHQLTPSLLDQLWTAVEDVNPFFHNAVKRMLGLDGQPQPQQK